MNTSAVSFQCSVSPNRRGGTSVPFLWLVNGSSEFPPPVIAAVYLCKHGLTGID